MAALMPTALCAGLEAVLKAGAALGLVSRAGVDRRAEPAAVPATSGRRAWRGPGGGGARWHHLLNQTELVLHLAGDIFLVLQLLPELELLFRVF